MTAKTKAMLASPDKEMRALGMVICQQEDPAVWCALLNYTGIAEGMSIPVLNHIESQGDILNIGHQVRYRGILDSPIMIVTDVAIKVQQMGNSTVKNYTYHTDITAKYWNKSTCAFIKAQDRLECFELVNIKKQKDESTTTGSHTRDISSRIGDTGPR